MKGMAGLISCHMTILRYMCDVVRNTFWLSMIT